MRYETIHVETDKPVSTITLNRPDKHNAINKHMLEELLDALRDVNKDETVRGVILRGNGSSFCSGADLKELQTLSPEDAEEHADLAAQIARLLELAETVSVAALHGNCLGGGLELACACDFRIAAEGTQLGQPEVKVGMVPGFGGTVRLPKLIGLGKAKHLILTGEPVSAEDAFEMELVDKVVPQEELLDEANRWVEKTLETSPLAYRRAKHLLYSTLDIPMKKGLELERNMFKNTFTSHDKKEGIQAFLEKRKPEFTGE